MPNILLEQNNFVRSKTSIYLTSIEINETYLTNKADNINSLTLNV